MSDRYLEIIDEEKYSQSESIKTSSRLNTRPKEEGIAEDDKIMSIIANDANLSSMVKDLKDTPIHDELLKSEDKMR